VEEKIVIVTRTLAWAILLPLWVVTSTLNASAESAALPAGPAECVVLLHGLWRTELSMKPLQWELADAGYVVVNPTYPSLSYPIEELAVMAVEEGVGGCRAQGLERIHFVTHSLGGILVREYLSHREIVGLERVVMLGRPTRVVRWQSMFIHWAR
jgi:triacylglycerol lipase